MKLTAKAIEALTREVRLRLVLKLDFSELWVNKLVEANKDNGPLTTAAALAVIREETGLTDNDILEEAKKQEEQSEIVSK